MLKFASDRVEREWEDARLSRKLKQMVLEAASYAQERWQWSFTITSIFRNAEEDAALNASGIHVVWRAVDVRTRGQPKAVVDDVTQFINRRWVYDPSRPALKVCFAEPHGTGPHGHYQVHPKTRRAAGVGSGGADAVLMAVTPPQTASR